MVDRKVRINDDGNYECRIEFEPNELKDFSDGIKYNVVERISKELADSMIEYVNNSIDWSDIVPKVQQSIVNNLMIREMRETLQERGKIG